MDAKILAFLTSQIFTVPVVIVCLVGVAIGLARREPGTRARLGMAGFGLLAASQLLSTLNMYQMYIQVEPGEIARFARTAAWYGLWRMGLEIAGLIILIVAVFQKSGRPAA
jgi:hypothetical protein